MISKTTFRIQSDHQLYQWLGVLGGVSILSNYFFRPEGAWDPLPLRIAVCSVSVVAALLSIYVTLLRPQTHRIAYSVFTFVLGYAFVLVAANRMSGDYNSFLLGVLAITSIAIRHRMVLLVYCAASGAVALALCFLIREPVTHPGWFAGLVFFIIIFAFFTQDFRNRSIDMLQSSEFDLKQVFISTPDAMLLAEPVSLRIIEANPLALALLIPRGTTALRGDELSGILRGKVTLPSDFVSQKKEVRREIEWIRADGASFYLDVVIRPVVLTGRNLLIVRFIDTTARVTTEKQLVQSHNILNNLDHLIIVANDRAEITYISPSVTQILGYAPEELLGDGWWRVNIGDRGDIERMKEQVKRIATGLAEAESTPYEQEYKDRNGQSQWIQWRDAAPGDNTLIGVGYLFTEQRREEQTRQLVFDIAEAAATYKNPQEFYSFVHREFTKVIDAKNFYIALKQEDGTLTSPYFVDEQPEGSRFGADFEKIPPSSLTAFAIRQNTPLLLTETDIRKLEAESKCINFGRMPKVWIGAPLPDEGKSLGLIGIVDYNNSEAFTHRELELLTFIASQIGAMIGRQQAQEKLARSEERSRLISEAAFEGFAVHSDQRIIESNARYAELFGYEPEELKGMMVPQLIAPSSMEKVKNMISNEKEVLYEFRGLRKDGTEFEGEALGRTILLGSQRARLVAIRDITERKKAEEALQSARLDARFKVYVQNSSEIISIISPAGLISYISPSVKRVLGRDPDDITGKPAEMLLDASSISSFREALSDVRTSPGHEVTGELTVIHADGSQRVLGSSLVNLTHDPMVNGVLISSRDITERIRFEESLRESEERFKSIFEYSPDAIFVEDIDGLILDVNEAACRLHGLTRDHLVGKTVFDLVGASNRERVMEEFRKWFTGEIKYVESTSAGSDGREVPVEIRAAHIHYGSKPAMIFQVRDITERKVAQADLEKSLTFLSTIYESTPDGILVVDPEGRVLNFNQNFLTMWGIPREAIQIGESGGGSDFAVQQLENPDDLNDIIFKTDFEPGATVNRTVSLKDGRVIEIYLRTFHTVSGVRGRQWFFHDVTGLKRVERALRVSERKSNALLDAIPDVMVRVRIDGVVTDYRVHEDHPLKQSIEKVMGRPVFEQLPPDVQDIMLDKIQSAIGTGKPQEMEYSISVNGEVHDVEVRMVRSGADEALMILRVVTERKRAERELLRRNFELDSFVYRSSHDLKAPLNSIMGLISIIRHESRDESTLNYIDLMNKSVIKLDTFIRDLTDFSRNERQDVAEQEVDFDALVKESVENLRFMENAERVKSYISIHQDSSFFSDSMRIGIVLNNLISNGVKYQNLKEPNPWVRIDIVTSPREAHITISDNGIGIREEHVPKMFQLFFRASLQSYGSGLGLYIVKNTVEKLGGNIRLETEFGKGTTFRISIPNRKNMQ